MNAKDYPEDFPDKLDYALHTLSPTQHAAFESWASKQEREDAEADAAALSEVFGTSLTPLEPSVELKARVMAQVAHTEQIQPAHEIGTDDELTEHTNDSVENQSPSASDPADDTETTAGPEDSAYARAKRRWFGAQGLLSPSHLTASHSISNWRVPLRSFKPRGRLLRQLRTPATSRSSSKSVRRLTFQWLRGKSTACRYRSCTPHPTIWRVFQQQICLHCLKGRSINSGCTMLKALLWGREPSIPLAVVPGSQP